MKERIYHDERLVGESSFPEPIALTAQESAFAEDSRSVSGAYERRQYSQDVVYPLSDAAGNLAEGVIHPEVEVVTRAQLLDMLEMALPVDKFEVAKREVSRILRDLVNRIRRRSAFYSEWHKARYVVIPRERIVTRDIAKVIEALEKPGSACIGMASGSTTSCAHHYDRDYYDPAKNQYVVICSCGTAFRVDSTGTPSADREKAFTLLNEHLEGADKSGLLKVGQVWKHTTGQTMRVVAVNVKTHMYGKTNITENPDTGELMATSGQKEDLVNWTPISE